MIIRNISFAGAGRVASALCSVLSGAGYVIDLVVSPSRAGGEALAESCGARWSPLPDFPFSSDLIIAAVPDHALAGLLSAITCRPGALIAHTAGSAGLEVFPEAAGKTGVFYPLQTFSQGRSIDFTGLPFLTEASDTETLEALDNLAISLGAEVFHIDAARRAVVHLAAVFINNFTNHMLAAGKSIAERDGLPFRLFRPLLKETVSKALDAGPENSQTGPAIRNDINTIEKHLDLLSFDQDFRDVYKEVTKSVMNHYRSSLKNG